MTVVSLCDLTGNMVRPWAEAGHDCLCFDVQHSIRADRTEKVGGGSITYRIGPTAGAQPRWASPVPYSTQTTAAQSRPDPRNHLTPYPRL